MDRFLRYVEHLLDALVLDAPGRVTEVIDRVLLDSYATISRDHHNVQREAVRRGVEVLRRKPELLVELLADSDGWGWQVSHDPETCRPPECSDGCVRVLMPTDPTGRGRGERGEST